MSGEIELNLKEWARGLGFIALGISKAQSPPFLEAFERFLSRGHHAQMEWMRSRIEMRKDPNLLLPGVKRVLSFAYPYVKNLPKTKDGLSVGRFSNPLLPDYHKTLKRRLSELTKLMKAHYPKDTFRVFVDSGPIMERSFAYSGGIGFFGKNTSLIIPSYGSYFFLGEILTTAEIPFEEAKPIESLCNGCELCIKACPQGAIVEPFLVDARRCLSYLTIEYRGSLEGLIKSKGITSFYGCDICQEVCPFNPLEKPIICLPESKLFDSLDEESFQRIFGHSALSRGGLENIRRNMAAIRELRE